MKAFVRLEINCTTKPEVCCFAGNDSKDLTSVVCESCCIVIRLRVTFNSAKQGLPAGQMVHGTLRTITKVTSIHRLPRHSIKVVRRSLPVPLDLATALSDMNLAVAKAAADRAA